MASEEADELREKGNACIRSGSNEEAVLHYTHAIKLDSLNATLYSNRSLALLRMQQFYHALQDAEECIRLKPNWAKGHFRKAEVEFATFHFLEAFQSYRRALELQPEDQGILDCIRKTTKERRRDQRADDQIPYLGAGLGIILGVIIVIADQVVPNTPTLSHPVLMALLTIVIAIIGFGLAKGFRYYIKCQRKSLLEPPVDLLGPEEAAEEETEEKKDEKTPRRYTKAQARQRFRKGKAS